MGAVPVEMPICPVVRLAAAGDSSGPEGPSGTLDACTIVWTKMFCVKTIFDSRPSAVANFATGGATSNSQRENVLLG